MSEVKHKFNVGDTIQCESGGYAIVRTIQLPNGSILSGKECLDCPYKKRCGGEEPLNVPKYWGVYVDDKNDLPKTVGMYGQYRCCYCMEGAASLVGPRKINLDKLKELCKGDTELFNEIKELL